MGAPFLHPDMHRLVVEAASDGILAADMLRGRILASNPAIELLTGHARESLADAPVEVLAPDPGDPTGQDFGVAVLGRAGLHEDVRVRRSDGFVMHANMTVGHVEAGAPVAVCVMRDVTERKLLERELITKHLALRSAFEDLERRNGEISWLSSRLALASKRAALAETFAGVAHALGNPLAALLSTSRSLGRLLAGAGPIDVQRRRQATELCARMDGQVARIEEIVRDLRRACRAGAARAERHVVSVAGEIENALALFVHRFGPTVEIVRDIPPVPPVRVVPDELHHAVSNLLDNALRAVGTRGCVWVEVRERDQSVEIAVEDTGPGLPPDLLPSLFQPFVTRSPDGTGLGLYVADRFARSHGGSLRLDRGRTGGARLVLSLPIAEDACSGPASS